MKKGNYCRYLFLTLLIFSTPYARGIEPPRPPCYVFCDLSQLQQFGGNTKMIQDQMAESIAQILLSKKNFPYWNFRPGDGNSYPFLKITVVKDAHVQWLFEAKLVVNDHFETPSAWNGPLLEPGELNQYGGVPAARDLVRMAGNQFELSVIQTNRDAITQNLEEWIPVRSVTMSDIRLLSVTSVPICAALPLSWDDYCGVANSQFMVKCRMDGSLVQIHSDGLGRAFKDPASNSIQGIVVEYKKFLEDKIEQHLSDLSKLLPFAIYLEKVNAWQAEGCSQIDGAPDRVP